MSAMSMMSARPCDRTTSRSLRLEEALAWLKARVAPGDLVYLKASRAVGLERIVELWDAPFSS